jgi:hypothetical protein
MPPKGQPNLTPGLQPPPKRKSPKEILSKAQQPTTTPVQTTNKAQQPQGMSPIKTNNVNSYDTFTTSSNIMKIVGVDSTAKSDPKESDTKSKEDSLSNMIASTHKTLFKSTPPA